MQLVLLESTHTDFECKFYVCNHIDSSVAFCYMCNHVPVFGFLPCTLVSVVMTSCGYVVAANTCTVHVCAGAASVPSDGLPQAMRVGTGHHRQVLPWLAGAQALPRSVPRHRRTQDRALLAESIGKTSDTQPY